MIPTCRQHGAIYIKAIDDAIILGADVLNMSLGSTAGFVSADDPEQQAVSRAVDNGILMSISAGNSAHFGNGFANPSASNLDIGVSGSPGLAYDSVQVASVENNYMDLDAATYEINGQAGKAPFMSASGVHPNALKDKSHELVAAGLGTPEEISKVDVKGKFALIERGTLSFIEKAQNAQAAGATGVIIYNNADGYISMATDPSITIPQLFMLKSDGAKLKAALADGEKVMITFNGDKTKAVNPEAGKMSSFSSWESHRTWISNWKSPLRADKFIQR
ncbi:S8 family serine peptidase [[Brevibacterium] frigoritolerans]|uniref:S8 family serine peptidase n=1 Tax=Peribacillus frigoritolerans TaxID=450367 RepID=A0A941FHJ9_9BACI|nr:S8 family serine peptidase [Peribacillus frigoritolerans]